MSLEFACQRFAHGNQAFLAHRLCACGLYGAGLWLTTISGDSAQGKRLPDGSYLQMASVSYGTNHSYSLSDLSPWKKHLARLPQGWRGPLHLLESTSSVYSHTDPGEPPYLAVFTLCKKPNPTFSPSRLAMTLCDEKGVTCDSCDGGPTASVLNMDLVCWVVFKTPPQQKILVVKFSSLGGEDGKTPNEVATFVIPNPLANLLASAGNE